MKFFAVNDCRCNDLFEVINVLGAAEMIDVGSTCIGAGMPGDNGAHVRHAYPSNVDDLAADSPNLKIIMAHPGWPWVRDPTSMTLHKGIVDWEMSG
ncbi:MAG: hypothetical protein EBQ82_03480 [Betaproteobacteria bacterium]|nr:hypothetical protein [Betaproteobacteria bacterium]NBY04469.1 hypothetical protein [Betaproteobacteria bacterium]